MNIDTVSIDILVKNPKNMIVFSACTFSFFSFFSFFKNPLLHVLK